jgi:membrane fusion protein, copper/silver efflux system
MTTGRDTLVGILIGAVVLTSLGAVGGYWFGRRGNSMQGMSAPRSPMAASQDRKPLYWYDPMVPNQHFDKPGKSPFMDMQLVPKYADEPGSEAGGLRVSPNTVQNLGIRLGRVERLALPSRLRAVGSVAFDERLLELVQSRVEGYVTELRVKAPFERVHRGQPLADILAPQWLEAEQQYLALLDTDADASGTLRKAARERLNVLGIPDTTVRELESTRKPNATTTIYSPIDGVVTELSVRAGSAFTSGASLFRINGLRTVWVNAQIPEAQVSAATAASTVQAHATAWPGTVFKGKVIALLPDVDPQTRTLTARVAIENEGFRLSPGMYVTLDFASSQAEAQLFVPTEAVIATGERKVVIVARGDEGFDVANVTTGREQDGRTAILSGLKEGDSIVLSGQFLIDSEASLTATVNRLQGVSPPEVPR